MRRIFRLVNIKGELFSSTFTSGLSVLIKLGSSLILTRLLDPTAYGVIGILYSVAFTVELLSDVGAGGLLIRNPRGGEKKFVHTLWTIRLIRSLVNFSLLYLAAPVIADIYGLPLLKDALRLFALWFPLAGLESMAFLIAQRNQQAKIGNYVDLATSLAMTLFILGMATVIKDYRVFIYGALLQRALMLVASYFFYREIGIGFAFDREAARDQFQFAKFVLPSSLLTIVLSQYDKVVLLKLFDLSLLGIYGLASNMIGPLSNLIGHNARVVLYPRCAEYFRSTPDLARHRYYTENTKLFMIAVVPPMVLAGLSQTFVALLYDERYHGAGAILTAMGVSAMFSAMQARSENFLVAAGHTRAVLGGNITRLLTMAPMTLIGYYLFGLYGFLWIGMSANIPVCLYFYINQRRAGLLDIRAELRLVSLGVMAFVLSFMVNLLVAKHIPPDFLRHLFHLKAHQAAPATPGA